MSREPKHSEAWAARGVRRPVRDRVLALVVVAAFAAAQYQWWAQGRRHLAWSEPDPVLGPLYFLANTRTGDDWLGWLLLAVLVPCILAFPIRPTAVTGVLAVAAILAWIGPGVFMIWQAAP